MDVQGKSLKDTICTGEGAGEIYQEFAWDGIDYMRRDWIG